MYSFSFGRAVNGKRERVFRVDLYGAFTAKPKIEIKHELGGIAISRDRAIEAQAYLFFAQSIESKQPETAKVLRTIAETIINEDETKRTEKGE